MEDVRIYRRELVIHIANKDAVKFVKKFHCALNPQKTEHGSDEWVLPQNDVCLRGLEKQELDELRELYSETLIAETKRPSADPWFPLC